MLIVGAIAIGVALALAVWRVRRGALVPDRARGCAARLPLPLPVRHAGRARSSSRPPRPRGRRAVRPRRRSSSCSSTSSLSIDARGRERARSTPGVSRTSPASRESSTWFRNTTTLSASTTVAVPGDPDRATPKKGALPIAQDYPNNLFTLLGKRYRMKVDRGADRLCPRRLCKRKQPRTPEAPLLALLGRARRLPAPDRAADARAAAACDRRVVGQTSARTPATELERAGDELPKVNLKTFYIGRVQRLQPLRGVVPAPARRPPTLDFLHVLFPHTPWLYLPDGRVRAVASRARPGRTGERWWSAQLAEQAWQRHLLQVGYTDRLLGTFIDRLHATGLWDKALVVVTADHGISFRGGDLRRDPSKTNLGRPRVHPAVRQAARDRPGPWSSTGTSRRRTSSRRSPSVLGVKIPWKTTGRSALAGGPGSSTVKRAERHAPYAADLAQRAADRSRASSPSSGAATGGRSSRRPARTGRSSAGRSGRFTWPAPGGDGDRGQASGASSCAPSRGARRSFRRRSSARSRAWRPGTRSRSRSNGRIAAVSAAYRDPSGGPVRFSVLPAESAFRTGRNSVRLFVVSGSPSSPAARARLEDIAQVVGALARSRRSSWRPVRMAISRAVAAASSSKRRASR